jgi:hypothetical protein
MIIMVYIQEIEMEMEITNRHTWYREKQARFVTILEDRKLLPNKPNKNRTWDMPYATSTQIATILFTSTLEFFRRVKKGIMMKS